MAEPVRLSLVYATWCPHCVPISTDRAPLLAGQLGVPLRLLDIDVRAQEDEADRLVRMFGTWDEDYVIPQAFLEWSDGTADAVLVAVRGSPLGETRKMWDGILADPKRILRRATP
jgi:hypothetical protein